MMDYFFFLLCPNQFPQVLCSSHVPFSKMMYDDEFVYEALSGHLQNADSIHLNLITGICAKCKVDFSKKKGKTK